VNGGAERFAGRHSILKFEERDVEIFRDMQGVNQLPLILEAAGSGRQGHAGGQKRVSRVASFVSEASRAAKWSGLPEDSAI